MLEQISKALAILLKKGTVVVAGEDKEQVSYSLAMLLKGLKCDFRVVVGEASDLIELFQ